MRRAFIHIGLPKTGTSAIQKALNEYRAHLAQYGLIHPDTPAINHVALIARFHPAGIGHRFLVNRGVTEARARALSEELWEQVVTAGEDIVLSCEQFIYGKDLPDNLFNGFSEAGFEPVFVCYVRHPVDLAVSAAQQLVKLGRRDLADVARQPRWPNAKAIIGRYLKTGARVIVRSFDDAKKVGAAQDFLAAIGYRDAAEAIGNAYVNASLSMDGAILADIYWRYFRQYGCQPFDKVVFLTLRGPEFTLPKAAKDHVRQAATDEVEWISRKFDIQLSESGSDAEFYDRLMPETVVSLLRSLNDGHPVASAGHSQAQGAEDTRRVEL